MTTKMLSIAATAVLSLVACAPSLARTHAHDVDAAPIATPTPAVRWKADPALREGMGRIRREILGLEHYRHGHIGPQQAVVLAGDIQRDVGFIVSHCKLAPKADAALHPILAELMRGAQAIASSPTDVAAIAPMRRALQRYPSLFDDPDRQAAD